MAAIEVEEPAPPIKYKTCVLKVSVHCEGCKRKVNKILHQVEGVYRVEIDIRQQKVTVVGNVDAEILIRKLTKSGKNAQLWPENTFQKEKKSPKLNNKEKQNDSQNNTDQESGQQGTEADVKEIKEPPKPEVVVVVQEPAKHSEDGGATDGGATDGTAKNGGDAGGVKAAKESGSKNNGGVPVVKESKYEGKTPEADASGDRPPTSVVEKKVGDSDGGAEKPHAGGGGSGKKKKKKGQNRYNPEGGEPSSREPAGTGSPNQYADPPPVSLSTTNIPPRQYGFQQFPPHYYAPAPPVHSVSYNTAYPTHTYTTSYYAAASPPPSYYAYSYPGAGMEPPPSDLNSYPPQPLDSFEMFSDENPNGCFIM